MSAQPGLFARLRPKPQAKRTFSSVCSQNPLSASTAHTPSPAFSNKSNVAILDIVSAACRDFTGPVYSGRKYVIQASLGHFAKNW